MQFYAFRQHATGHQRMCERVRQREGDGKGSAGISNRYDVGSHQAC